jgi:hypothetical protein
MAPNLFDTAPDLFDITDLPPDFNDFLDIISSIIDFGVFLGVLYGVECSE